MVVFRLGIITAILFGLVIQSGIANAQCPERFIFRESILFDTDTVHDNGQTLAGLLRLSRDAGPCLPTGDSLAGILWQKVGELYGKAGDFSNAIRYARLSITAGAPDTSRYLTRSFFNLYKYYDSLRQYVLRDEAIDSCIARESRADVDYEYTCKVLPSRILTLYDRGEYNLCYNYASLGEKLIPRYYNIRNPQYTHIFFITYQTDALYSLGKYQQADELLRNRKGVFFEGAGKNYVPVYYALQAFMNESRQDYTKAAEYFRKAYQADLQTREKYICSQALSHLAKIYSEQFGESEKALEFFRQSLRYAYGLDSFYILGNTANLYRDIRQYDSAFHYYQVALDKLGPGISESDLLVNTSRYVQSNTSENVLNLVLDKSDAYLKRFLDARRPSDLMAAARIYRIADHLLNNIKENQTEMELKLFWRSYARRLYERGLNAALMADNPEDAFYFFEKSRAVLLHEQILEQHMFGERDMLRLAQMKRAILSEERNMNVTDTSSQRFIDMQQAVLKAKRELGQLEQNVKNKYPLFHQTLTDTSFISVSDFQHTLLHDDQSFLELFSGDSLIFALLITREKVFFYPVEKNDFDSTVDLYISYLGDLERQNKDFRGFVNTAHHLYNLIFQDRKIAGGSLVISQESRLFPFESLVSRITNGTKPQYLVEKHPVSYTYSARFLTSKYFSHVTNDREPGGRFLGVAPVSYPYSRHLPSLEGSDHSLAIINAYFRHTGQLIAEKATKNNFQEQFPDFDIIQLYTHASDSSNNGEPVIWFRDSLLYLSDLIMGEKLRTRLIVLSACETGAGRLYKGEGVFSFNRAFAALGVPCAVVNLWSVDNVATYRITELFYLYLSRGLPPDVALQNAKLEFIHGDDREKQLPFYWAAPVVMGKIDEVPIYKTARADLPVLLGFALLFLGSLLLFFRTAGKINPTPGIREIAA